MQALSDTQRELDGLRNLSPQAISAAYDRYFPEVYRFVRYRLGDESLAEDVASDVFVHLLEALRKKRGPKINLKAWLISTAAHMVTDHLRRSYRRPQVDLPEDLLDTADSIVDKFDTAQQQAMLRKAMQALTPDQQTVLTLRFGQGYSLEETAHMMKKKANAIKALQFRALAALRRQVGEVADE